MKPNHNLLVLETVTKRKANQNLIESLAFAFASAFLTIWVDRSTVFFSPSAL